MLIGKGGSGLREMQEKTGVKVRYASPADARRCRTNASVSFPTVTALTNNEGSTRAMSR